VAIENFGNDANIGAAVRTADAFAVDNVPGAVRCGAVRCGAARRGAA